MISFCYFYESMDIGGCQLLIEKLALYTVRSAKPIVLCKEIDDSIYLEMRNNSIEVVTLNENWDSDRALRKEIDRISRNSEKVNFTVFTWFDYVRISSLKNRNIAVLWYAIHENALRNVGISNNSRLLSSIRRRIFRNIIRNLIDKQNIVVMDEITLRNANDYYGFSDLKPKIIRIPIDTEPNDFDLNASLDRLKKKRKNLLGIARSEFPFKGYLIGMIKLIREDALPDDYCLTIVSYGEQYEILRNEFDKCSEEEKKRITIIGKTSYKDLKALFDDAYVYLGMGTTILDASKYGVISIPVIPYEDEVKGDHFFCDDYTSLIAEDGDKDTFIDLLKELDDKTEEQKKAMILKAKEIIDNYYSINKCFDLLEETFAEHLPSCQKSIALDYKFRRLLKKINMLRGLNT